MPQAVIVSSLEAIPAELIWPGMLFAIYNARLDAFDIYTLRPNATAAGFSGNADAWVQVAVAAAQTGAQYQAGKAASAAQEREINNAFNALAIQVNGIFAAAESNPTAANIQAAAAAYQQIAQAAAQYPTKGITEWWSSPSYNASYQRRLAALAQRSQGSPAYPSTGGTLPGGSNNGGASPGNNYNNNSGNGGLLESLTSNPLLLLLGVVLILKK